MTTEVAHADIDSPRLRSLRREDRSLEGLIVTKQAEVNDLKAQQKSVQQEIKDECQYELERSKPVEGAA